MDEIIELTDRQRCSSTGRSFRAMLCSCFVSEANCWHRRADSVGTRNSGLLDAASRRYDQRSDLEGYLKHPALLGTTTPCPGQQQPLEVREGGGK